MSAVSGDISVAMLEYCEPLTLKLPLLHDFLSQSNNIKRTALMPESPFPTQLRQANAAIIYLLNKGVRPANIIVGGDSAGGNLVLQLASHILHPLPSIPPPPKLSEPLGGGVLISPWNALNVDAPSYTRNNGKDVLLIPAYEFVLSLASAGVTPEVRSYGEPLSAPPSWWEGLDTVYGRLLITAGEHECPFDHVMQSSKILSRYVRDTTTVVEPLTAHGEVVIRFGTSEGGRGYKDYESIIAFSLRAFQDGSIHN
jgi:acetyl esterase/lipase